MSITITERIGGLTKLIVGFVVAALVLAMVATLVSRADHKTITADFTQTNSIYKGSQVRILGVPVGKVTKLEPRGDVIRATLQIDKDVKVPADARAVVVSPAIVGDRFMQLAPAYTGGAVMKDGAHLDVNHTQVPIELDQVYKAFNDLSVALGPNGANKNGSLSRLVSGLAHMLDGQGQQVNQTITNFSKLSATLADNSDELFASVHQIGDFVSMLKRNDATVRSFERNTAGLASVLADERGDLSGTVKALASALIDVQGLLKDNDTTLRSNIANLVTVTQTLSNRRAELNAAWKAAPDALINVSLAYNGRYGSLDSRTNVFASLLQADPLVALQTLVGPAGIQALQQNLGTTDLSGLLGGLIPSLPRGSAANTPAQASGASVAEMLGVQ